MQTSERHPLKKPPPEAGAGPYPIGKALGLEISDAQYQKLAKLVYSLCGINLGDSKKELLKARLAKRLRATGYKDVRQYIAALGDDPGGQELVDFLDVITTNKTDFFREPAHFDFLSQTVLTSLGRLCGSSGDLRIWSAASSTGEEPYTIAITLLENAGLLGRRQVQLLASDISTQVLQTGKNGIYAMERVAGIPRPILTRHFQRGQRRWQGYVRVRPELRSMVEFRRINLMEPFSFEHRFHVIFCRNVMIYFDKQTQENLVNKFHQQLEPGGYLLVGHSESLTGIKHPLKFVQPAVYRREG